MLSLTSGKHRN